MEIYVTLMGVYGTVVCYGHSDCFSKKNHNRKFPGSVVSQGFSCYCQTGPNLSYNWQFQLQDYHDLS